MYTLNMNVINANGDELLDKRLTVDTLDDIGLMDTLGYNIMNDAKENEVSDGLVFDNQDEAEFSREDII